MTHIRQGLANSFAEACHCSFSVADIVDKSVLLQCKDSISAEVSMQIKPVNHLSVDELICQFHRFLTQHQNVIELGTLPLDVMCLCYK